MAQRTTLADVADKAGVSVTTASLALRSSPRVAPATTRRVTEAAGALRYRLPRAAAQPSATARTVGLIAAVSFDELLTDPFQVTVVMGLTEALERARVPPTLLPAPDAAHRLDLLARVHLDGVVLVNSPQQLEAAWRIVSRRALPAVTLEPRDLDAIVGVRWIDYGAMRHLAQRIRALGHERAVVVTLPFGAAQRRSGFVPVPDPATIPSQPVRERLASVVAAGIEVAGVYEAQASSVNEGARAGNSIATLPELPTVIVCQSDVLAAGVITALSSRGLRVPHDVSVTGFDGLDLPLISPHVVTTIVQDGYEKGRRAAAQLLDLMAGRTPEPMDMMITVREGTTLGAARSRDPVRT